MDEKEIAIITEETAISTFDEVMAYAVVVSKLTELALTASAITTPDKDMEKRLVSVRTTISKMGKFAREDFTQRAKGVIEKEKALIEIIEPEEKRLKEIRIEAERLAEQEKRKVLLPERTLKLTRIGDDVMWSDDMLLGMDEKQFEEYYNGRVATKNAKDRAEIEAREKAVRDAEEAQRREAEMKEREEKARIEERERAERQEIERKEREASQAEWDKKVSEEKAEAERNAREQDIAYQMFLASHGYSEETKGDFHLSHVHGTVIIYKLLGTFTPD